MRLKVLIISAMAMLIGGLPAMGGDRREVELFNWQRYVAPEVITHMSEDFDWNVRLTTYERADDAEAALLARGSGYELAVIASESVGRLIDAGVLRDISNFDIANRARLEQGLWGTFIEAMPEASKYAVPYAWGTLGLAYDVEAIQARLPDAPMDSWSLLFEPDNAKALQDCGISIVDSNEEVIAAILTYLGRDPHSREQEDLDAAFEVLEAIAPYVRYFDTDQYEGLLNGKVCAAISWSANSFGPMSEEEGGQVRYVLPKEGTNLWTDMFVIPDDVEEIELSLRLINHFGDPAVIAANAPYTLTVVRSDDMRARIEEPYYDHPALRLPDDVADRLYYVKPHDGAGKLQLDRRWRKMQLGL
ncbi:spermidine-binding protein SpuE [Shimia sp. NS0008-38b]|uniref:extracellular solute-binding protein n=1 Tax=Shimia sp. NS0008-38b TaxID=3127653 RepID=UPI0031047752